MISEHSSTNALRDSAVASLSLRLIRSAEMSFKLAIALVRTFLMLATSCAHVQQMGCHGPGVPYSAQFVLLHHCLVLEPESLNDEDEECLHEK